MTEELLKERKEAMLALINDPTYVPMKIKELAMLLDVPREKRDELKEVLDALVADGKVGLSKRGKYGKPEAFTLVGTFCGHAKGFGFVTVEGMDQDVFIPAEKAKDAMHGDTVQITASPASKGKRPEGAVIKVIERANQTIVGFYQKNKNFGFVVPDNQKINADVFIPQGKDMGAVTGHKVVVRLTDFGGEHKNPEGVITEIIGHVNDPGTDILSIVKAYGIPDEYPPEVMKQVSRIPDEVAKEDLAGRKDIRDWQTVTIDGEDAKDLDDAITISRESYGYRLGVHIADVSHYVTEGSPLDEVLSPVVIGFFYPIHNDSLPRPTGKEKNRCRAGCFRALNIHIPAAVLRNQGRRIFCSYFDILGLRSRRPTGGRRHAVLLSL